MAYTINLTDGTIFATIADGTINTSSSMTLVGKNYAGYGEFLDENFIHLLENGSNTTAPTAPLTGQIWWDKGNALMKVYNGSTWKVISASTASSTAPTSNVTGDLWYDTTNSLLKVYTGSTWLTVGPSVTDGTGAQANVITDNGSALHDVVEITVANDIVAIFSQDATFTPSPALTGFSTIGPGLQLSTAVTNGQFRGTADEALLLDGYEATDFMLSGANTSTTGSLSVVNDGASVTNGALRVGADSDFNVSVSGTDVTLANQTNNGNIKFSINDGGVQTTALTIYGANGTVAGNMIQANYADVAERFEADVVDMPAGTVVELGGDKEITRVRDELSDSVFGVISTRAAYLMNSRAGTDATHPPVAMTGRVPVNTVGTVRKGDRLVSAGNGLARAAQPGEATAFNVIGRALADKTTAEEGTVEAIVTIK